MNPSKHLPKDLAEFHRINWENYENLLLEHQVNCDPVAIKIAQDGANYHWSKYLEHSKPLSIFFDQSGKAYRSEVVTPSLQ